MGGVKHGGDGPHHHHGLSSSSHPLPADEWMSPSDDRFIPLLLTSVLLVCFGGVMSGLQQGMMQISADPVRYPLKGRLSTLLGPLCRRRHLTLVTLLIANACAMEALPVCLDILMPHGAAVVISVTLVVLFGEIIPQALCLRFPLRLSAGFAWLVWALVVPLLPIAYGISSMLDALLGADAHEKPYNRQGLWELVRTHDEEHGGPLSADERDIISGALGLKETAAKSVVTSIDSVFALSEGAVLDDSTMRAILDSGKSRVPVFSATRANIIGMLLVKHLARVAMSSNGPPSLRQVTLTPAFIVSENVTLFELLKIFRTGASHLAVVVPGSGPPRRRRMTAADQAPIAALGIVTLEDVFEKLLGRDIDDETDIRSRFADRLRKTAARARALRDDISDALKRHHTVAADYCDSSDNVEFSPLLTPQSGGAHYGALDKDHESQIRKSSTKSPHHHGEVL